jgi:hypothetical protein
MAFHIHRFTRIHVNVPPKKKSHRIQSRKWAVPLRVLAHFVFVFLLSMSLQFQAPLILYIQ